LEKREKKEEALAEIFSPATLAVIFISVFIFFISGKILTIFLDTRDIFSGIFAVESEI